MLTRICTVNVIASVISFCPGYLRGYGDAIYNMTGIDVLVDTREGFSDFSDSLFLHHNELHGELFFREM